jgi:MFS family permease
MDDAVSTRRKIYILFVLSLAAMLATMDRSLSALLQEPIRHEFHLNDSAIGVYAGLVFAIPYSLVSLPFGLVADRFERGRIVAGCLALWSLMSAVCGFVGSFPQLLLARTAVSAGEGASAPAVQSIIGDLFSDQRRATAMGFYYVATPLGAMISLIAGGLLAMHFGWRAAYLAVGGPGLVLSLLVFFTVRAPPQASASATSKAPPLREVAAFVRSQRSLFHLIVGLTLGQLTIAGIGAWTVSFFVRYHHLSLAQIGAVMGPMAGITGILGMMLGGYLTDRAGRNDPRGSLWVIIAALVLVTPCMLTTLLSPGIVLSYVAYAGYTIAGFVWMPGSFAATQSLAGSSRRGSVAAIVLACVTLLGGGFGPQLIGVLSDLYKPYAGAESLRWSLVTFALLALWAAAHMWAASRTYLADLKRAAAEPEAPEQADWALLSPAEP